MNYLLSQSKIFKHFMAATGGKVDEEEEEVKRGPRKKDQGSSSGKRRMTEKEEDELLMTENTDDHQFQTTRLTTQPSIMNGTMRPYQIEGLNFLIGLYERGINGILADEMGLGKTMQTIALLAFLREFRDIKGPHLVIVPKTTMGNWMREFTKWCPDIKVVKFHGTAEDRKEQRETILKPGSFDAIVTSYEMVIKEKSVFCKYTWRYLIIDEAHRIKNEGSILSQVVRSFESQNRLLITGTPLQNNLRELWALLNFLLPDVFSSADDFDSWFASVENDDNLADQGRNELIHQLHAVLRPFLIRRLKSEVARDLPPKKETVLYTRLSETQVELYRSLLKKDVDAINGQGGDRVRLLNILMQLRKCCNHPYLFDGVEDRSLDPFGDHVVTSCGKLSLLDKLLPRLREDGHRVLIFCQMTRALDILEDYCCEQMRDYPYCRIDGSTDGETRDAQIDDFNKEDSEKFIFLLSTRAGGLGINLATADTVILYDSDWNPQVDLQAMDRAHRIGQKNPVNVYRLIAENTVEERILKKAMEKLRLDTLVIQQGRLSEQKKNLGKDELLDMIRFGADTFFKADTGDFDEDDLDAILSRGEAKTKEMNDQIAEGVTSNTDLMSFKLGDAPKTIFEFEGENFKGKASTADHFFLDVGKRDRRKYYEEAAPPKPKVERVKQRMKAPKEPTLQDFQFFNLPRIKELFEKERKIVDTYNREADQAAREGKEIPEEPETLTEEESQEREELLKEGFDTWTRREFQAFLRGCERYGRSNIEGIVSEIGDSKSLDEVVEYSRVFWDMAPTALDSWAKVLRQIEEGEAKIVRRQEMEEALQRKMDRYHDPWKELDVTHAGNKGKAFTEEEDRWLICMTWKLGYGRWDELKLEARKAWQFRFDWYIKSRTPLELKRRVDLLIRAIEKENEELDKEARSSRGRRGGNRKRARGGKRKASQATLDEYILAVSGNKRGRVSTP
uniref:Uncharacterized protein n=1 Tax=Compsopogon caeruleus TaxID=31354 RepID=A0A7S1XF10_9RHOD